ncbi:MAG: M20 family metallopeptidase [Oscillospiraceae bacterium]|nr:M20 family metallopeptidase [Oscillospiraceae bacterium]
MYQEQIKAYFAAHRAEITADIAALVRVRSDRGEAAPGAPFGPGPRAALDRFLEIAGGMGFAVRNYDGYVGAVDLQAGPAQLDILAHLDVVPAADDWTVCKPFEPVERDGMLYGRGAADDKGPAVAALWAMRCVKELGVPLPKNVRLIAGTDEECGSSDLAYYYQKERPAPMTFSPDADFPVINIEKGGLRAHITAEFAPAQALPRLTAFHSGFKVNVVPDTAEAVVAGLGAADAQPVCDALAAKTGLAFRLAETAAGLRITAAGTGAHAACPEAGNNALTGLLALAAALPLADCDGSRKLRALSELFPHGDYLGKALGVAQADELSGPLTISLNMLDVSETGLNACFDCRAPLCANDGNMRQVTARRCAAAGLALEDAPMYPPHHVPADSPLVRTLLDIYERYTGRKGAALSTGGGTYVHDLENGVAFGCAMPGVDTHMHGADERVILDDLLLAGAMFAQAILELCGA